MKRTCRLRTPFGGEGMRAWKGACESAARGGTWVSPAHEKFDLLVSDVRMPAVDGIALARLSMDDHPEMPVLLMSGEGVADA